MPPRIKPIITSISEMAKYVPVRKILAAGAIIGGITLAGTTLMSGYADTRERVAGANISEIAAKIQQDRETVKNDMYRNVIQREEAQRSPEVYDLERLSSIGKTPGGQQSYSGLIIIAVIAIAGIFLLKGAFKK